MKIEKITLSNGTELTKNEALELYYELHKLFGVKEISYIPIPYQVQPHPIYPDIVYCSDNPAVSDPYRLS